MADPAPGSTAAEATKALRDDALRDRATAPKATAGPADKALVQKALQQQPTTAAPSCPLSRAQFRDKLRGMLLMGAYGDALGGCHELEGLDGIIAADPIIPQLKPFSQYGRVKPEPFGVWFTPVNAAETGIITDDTSVRLMIVQQWLSAHAQLDEVAVRINPDFIPSPPTEAGFRDWLRAMKNEPTGTPPAQHAELLGTRKLAIAEILCWMCKADPQPDCPGIACKTNYYLPGIPVVVGQFLYLELAAIYGCCDRSSVLSEFSRFSILDQKHAGFSTGLLAAMLSQAICRTGNLNFTQFFNTQAMELLAGRGPSDVLQDAFDKGKDVGSDTSKTLGEMLLAIKTRLYDPVNPAGATAGLGKYDPALFLKQMTAAVQWGGGDPRNVLSALAFGVGDSDTIPAQLGSIMGAYYGERELRRDLSLATELSRVEAVLEKYFVTSEFAGQYKPFRLNDVVDTLELLAAQHGCCKHV